MCIYCGAVFVHAIDMYIEYIPIFTKQALTSSLKLKLEQIQAIKGVIHAHDRPFDDLFLVWSIVDTPFGSVRMIANPDNTNRAKGEYPTMRRCKQRLLLQQLHLVLV